MWPAGTPERGSCVIWSDAFRQLPGSTSTCAIICSQMSTPAPVSNQSEHPQLITVSQAASLLAVHRSTVRRWIREGKIRAYRLGGRGVRLTRADVLQLVTPLEAASERDVGTQLNEQDEIAPLTRDEIQRGLQAVAAMRRLRTELVAKHGQRHTESWRLLNESRDERTADLLRALES